MLQLAEGTKSVLFGAHSPIHSFYVTLAWKQLYGTWPSLQELVCIWLHDLGYIGKNYITNKSNAGHADLGAWIAYKLFDYCGWCLVMGHSSEAQKKWCIDESKLALPDDWSWAIAPLWWMRWNKWVEGFKVEPLVWKQAMRDKVLTGDKRSGTELSHRLQRG